MKLYEYTGEVETLIDGITEIQPAIAFINSQNIIYMSYSFHEPKITYMR